MAVISKQTPSIAGAELSFTAAGAAGDSFHNSGREVLVFKNSGGAGRTVTFDAPGVDNFGFSGNALDVPVVVPDGATHFVIGPFTPTARFNDGNSRVQMTYSSEVGLSVAVMGI